MSVHMFKFVILHSLSKCNILVYQVYVNKDMHRCMQANTHTNTQRSFCISARGYIHVYNLFTLDRKEAPGDGTR